MNGAFGFELAAAPGDRNRGGGRDDAPKSAKRGPISHEAASPAPAGKPAVERETVRIGLDTGQSANLRTTLEDGNDRTAGGLCTLAGGVEAVAHQQRGLAIDQRTSEDAGAV